MGVKEVSWQEKAVVLRFQNKHLFNLHVSAYNPNSDCAWCFLPSSTSVQAPSNLTLFRDWICSALPRGKLGMGNTEQSEVEKRCEFSTFATNCPSLLFFRSEFSTFIINCLLLLFSRRAWYGQFLNTLVTVCHKSDSFSVFPTAAYDSVLPGWLN